MTLNELFDQIKEYHEKLGYPTKNLSVKLTQKEANEIILALHSEIEELKKCYPWKPWRPDDYQKYDFDNMLFEIVDILFFLGSFMELFDLSIYELKVAFGIKLGINYKRIERGYNETNKSKTGEDL